MPTPIVPNPAARRLFLHRHALAEAPTGAAAGEDLARLIRRIGFVQVDSITTVERAHHMILFSRRQSYRPAALKPLLERDRQMWEHWTHDASILPVETFPYWKHRFADQAARLAANAQRWLPEDHAAQFDTILNRIARFADYAGDCIPARARSEIFKATRRLGWPAWKRWSGYHA